jgi:transcriptional regulator of acetoin/glycerol metabolism
MPETQETHRMTKTTERTTFRHDLEDGEFRIDFVASVEWEDSEGEAPKMVTLQFPGHTPVTMAIGNAHALSDLLRGRRSVQNGDALRRVLREHENNIARVARVLGVTRRTIYLRMKRYGIPRERTPKSNTPRGVAVAGGAQ